VEVVVREARLLQQRVAAAIRAAAPKIPHRGSVKNPTRPTLGGSLAAKVLAPEIVKVKPWGAVVSWYDLGQLALWFSEGTKTGGKRVRQRGGKRSRRRIGGTFRQQPRPIPWEGLDPEALARALERDAAVFFGRADTESEAA
jgi:hypothetical protein